MSDLTESPLIRYAKSEFIICGWLNADGTYCDKLQQMACENILELLSTFLNQGHTYLSGNYILPVFNKVVHFEPLTPLTGIDAEWSEIGPNRWQNKRYPSVFKGPDGNAYDSEIAGRKYIKFPYTPKQAEVAG